MGEGASSSLWGRLGREERWQGASWARKGASQSDCTPGKTLGPQVLALGKGDNSGEGSVDGGAEGRKSLARVSRPNLSLARATVSSTPPARAHAHRPLEISSSSELCSTLPAQSVSICLPSAVHLPLSLLPSLSCDSRQWSLLLSRPQFPSRRHVPDLTLGTPQAF